MLAQKIQHLKLRVQHIHQRDNSFGIVFVGEYIYAYGCVYMYVYLYSYLERLETEREMHVYIYILIYTVIHTYNNVERDSKNMTCICAHMCEIGLYVYIYISIY